jgi:6-phosphofructokinase 1
MVGIQYDKICLTPLEQAIKWQSEIDLELVKVSDIVSS